MSIQLNNQVLALLTQVAKLQASVADLTERLASVEKIQREYKRPGPKPKDQDAQVN
jgi:uncharacterized coiled-coil protein SlyX